MTRPAIVGIDLGKNWFHVVGLDEGGATVLRKKLNRAQLAEYGHSIVQLQSSMLRPESCQAIRYLLC